MIISRTPFRISFFGGGTDYPAWYRQHGGSVLAATLDKYCYLQCRWLPPFFEHRHSVIYSCIEHCQTLDEIKHPPVREALRYLKIERGVDIHYAGDLPARSGMGSSSAFTVGLLHALHALRGEMLSKHQLALESIHIEQDLLKETVGSQDQVLAAYGGINHVTFSPNGEFSVRALTIPHERIQELNAHLMLFYTGIKRTAENIARTYVDNIESKARQFEMAKGFVTEALAILTGKDDLMPFGALLHEAWKAKRSLSAAVSNPEVDSLYDAARAAGAVGGKLTGAGGGGFMLLFVPPGRQAHVREALGRLLCVPIKFEFTGSQIILYDPEADYSVPEADRSLRAIDRFHELTPEAAPEESPRMPPA